MAKIKKKKEKNITREKATEKDVGEKQPFIKRLLKPKMMIIITLVFLILAGGGFAGWFLFLKGDGNETLIDSDEPQKQMEKQNEDGAVIVPPPFPEIFELEPIEKAGLKKSDGLNFISLGIALELSDPEMRDVLEESRDTIRQIIDAEAGTFTWAVLRSPEGKLQFKYSLLKKINKTLTVVRVRNLYFTRFIMMM